MIHVCTTRTHACTIECWEQGCACQRIGRLCKGFREFGYADLTIAEARTAYHIAMLRQPTAKDGIIAMLTRSQLVEAGLVE